MKLAKLECQDTKVTDLSPLNGMPLTHMNCNGSQVSDPTPLQSCTALKSVTFYKTKVIAASIAALQKALPNCKIEWDDPAKPKTAQRDASGTK